MIRATKLFSHHGARRLQNGTRTIASSTQASSTGAAAGAVATGVSSNDNWSAMAIAAGCASLSALAVGLASGCKDENPSAAAKCEEMDRSSPSWNSQEYQDEEEGEPTIRWRTIPVDKLSVKGTDGGDGGKSERAFSSALKNGLFNTYADGADDLEEADDDDDDTIKASPNSVTSDSNAKLPTDNAITERFVSFSPPISPPATVLRPRTSIRHSNRRAQEDNASLMATSIDKALLREPAPTDAKVDKEAIIKRIDSVRENNLSHNQVYTKNMYYFQSTQIKENMRKRFSLFALPSSERLGEEMASLLGTSLNCLHVGAFTDGETSVKIEDSIRGKQVYVVGTTRSSDAIMELLLTISALRRGSAKRITVVIPYYGYCRQDRRSMFKREPIAAADMAKLLEEMGVDSVICCDLHNPLVKGFFSPTVPVDHVTPGPVAAAYFYEELFGTRGADDGEEKKEPEEGPKITVVAAHENQVFRANGFRNALQKLSGNKSDIRVALISNTKALRWSENSETTTIVGDVEGRKCIIVDDIINTGGTMRSAIDMVGKSGASEVYAWATHGVLHLPENDAPQKIQDMDCLKYLLISNSVAIERELPQKIRKLSIAPLLAESVARSLHNESITGMMKGMAAKSDK